MVAITGATGHLGTVLTRRLVEDGESVRYVVRSGSNAAGPEHGGAERHVADLLDVDSLSRAFEGASVIYHAAARISISAGDEAELHRVNVEGTRCALEAARRASVDRLVYVGSIEAFPLERGPYPITERHGIDPDHTVMEYGRTKAIATRLVLDSVAAGMDSVVCAPTALIGPPDYRTSAIGAFVRDFLSRRLPAYIDGGFYFVDVRDVADAIVSAARSGTSGGVYLLSGRYVSVPQIMSMLEAISGVPKPRFRFPIGFVLPFLPWVEAVGRLFGTIPRFTTSSLELLSLGVRVDSSRARSELGFRPRPIEETLADTVAWFRAVADATGGATAPAE